MTNWREVADISEFAETDRKVVDFGGGNQIGLFKLSDGFYAISVWCSHQKTSLMQGEVIDCEIECPLHGARFDLKTGRNTLFPAVKPIPSYEVRVENNKIFIKF